MVLQLIKPAVLPMAKSWSRNGTGANYQIDRGRTKFQGPIEAFADRVSAWFVPIVIVLAILTFVV